MGEKKGIALYGVGIFLLISRDKKGHTDHRCYGTSCGLGFNNMCKPVTCLSVNICNSRSAGADCGTSLEQSGLWQQKL
jgi:hypothetical protein